MAVGVAVALLLALTTIYRISPLKGEFEKKSIEYAAAKTQLLVDSPRSSIPDIDKDLVPLTARAGIYARLLTSPAALEEVGKESKIPGAAIYAQGPFEINLPRIEQEPTAERRNTQIVGERATYRLRFENNPEIPVVNVYAQAPTPGEATGLANGAVRGLRNFLTEIQEEQQVPSAQRVEIRQLGRASGGMVNSGASGKMAALVFFAALAGWCVLVLLVARLIGDWRASQRGDADPFSAIDPFEAEFGAAVNGGSHSDELDKAFQDLGPLGDRPGSRT